MGNVRNTFVAQSVDGGVAWAGPLDTPMPTDATSTPDEALENLGTVSKDGLMVGIKRTSKTEQDFDGNDYVDIQEEFNGEFKLTLMDIDLEAAKRVAYGDDKVHYTAATEEHGARYHVEHSTDQLPLKAFVFSVRSGPKRKRWCVEVGRVTDIAEVKVKRDEASKLELTIKAKPNSNGNLVEEYGDDGKKVVTPAPAPAGNGG